MKTLFRLKSYICFLWRSTNQHGVHSPFVFNLITKCFYDRKKKIEYTTLRKTVLSDPTIQNTTFITNNNAKLLFRIVWYFQPRSILETSHSSELIPTVLLLGNPEAKLFLPDSENNLPETLDMVYFNFMKAPSLSVFETLLLKTHNNSFFIFEGIHKTSSMERFWKNIKTHQKITVTIDTYTFGLVFFRKEQVKEHFTIRI